VLDASSKRNKNSIAVSAAGGEKSALDMFVSENGILVVEKAISLTGKYRNSATTQSDAALLFAELSLLFRVHGCCEHNAVNKRAAKGLSRLYTATVKSASFLVRKCLTPREDNSGYFAPDVDTVRFLNSVVSDVAAASRRMSCMNIVSATECLLDAVKVVRPVAGDDLGRLVCHLLLSLESITRHDAELHSAAMTSPIDRNRKSSSRMNAASMSDSDSAFYASDGSLERGMVHTVPPLPSQLAQHRFFELKHYLEVLMQTESQAVAGMVIEHLGRLLHVCAQFRAKERDKINFSWNFLIADSLNSLIVQHLVSLPLTEIINVELSIYSVPING
jgi:hypothetical protein